MQSNVKYYRININELGPTGLFNQLMHIVTGLILANLMGRNIYKPTFLPNYNSLNSVPLSDVIDVEHLNKVLLSLNMTCQIHMDVDVPNDLFVISQYRNNFLSKIEFTPVQSILDKLRNEDQHKYLDLGSVFGQISEYKELELNIHKNILFQPQYYKILEYCKLNYLQGSYNAVHLRLEDDWISCMSPIYCTTFEGYSELLMRNYNKSMESLFLPTDKIYIASHLGKAKNRNNNIIERIREKYPNIVTVIDWRKHFTVTKGREIDAIIDYLICLDSQKFIGIYWSTYSRFIGNINISKGKVANIINNLSV